MLYHCGMDRVLEVGGYAAGFCGRLFAQCGAEVAHVEAACSRVGEFAAQTPCLPESLTHL